MEIRRTRAVVDLDALDHNLELLAARAPGRRVMPAVKADAYGHGAAAVAGACERSRVEMMAVATVHEFLYLREQGITTPILILQELFPEERDTALRSGARLTVGSLAYATAVSEAAQRNNTTAMIHINVDTGMGRMGLFSSNPTQDILEICSLGNVTVEGVYSHFPDSDEADKTFARDQIRQFTELLAYLREYGITPRFTHIANSGALIDFPEESAFDLIRPGVALYGMYPSPDVRHDVGLQPVMSLESAIVKLTRYDREWTVGYGRSYAVGPGSLIGIVPIGYGDGYRRSLSNRGEVLCHGRRIPIAGRVSMDMIAIDVTGIAPRVRLGDPVVLMGRSADDNGNIEEILAEDIAAQTGTIPYEVTCGITARVPRVYLRDKTPVATQMMGAGYQLIS